MSFEANFAERMPPLCPRPAVDAIGPNKAVFVLEDERGHFERDSIVKLLVAVIFRFVPFVTHSVYTGYMTFRFQRNSLKLTPQSIQRATFDRVRRRTVAA